MGRLFAILAALNLGLAPVTASTQALQTHRAEIAGTPDGLVAALPRDLIQSTTEGGTIFVAYAGLDAPDALVAFARGIFGAAATASLTKGAPANVSIALVPSRTGTRAQLMLHGSSGADTDLYQSVFGMAVPNTATLLLSEGSSAACGGQLVLDEPLDATIAAETYAERLRTRGFLVGETENIDGTLLLANGTPCSAIVFIQPDRTAPGRSTIVVRYLED